MECNRGERARQFSRSPVLANACLTTELKETLHWQSAGLATWQKKDPLSNILPVVVDI